MDGIDAAHEAVIDATERAIAAASHLTDMDAGAVATLRGLAGAIDYLLEHGGINAEGKFDNVSIPTYLRFCESLGLTPAGRAKLAEKKGPEGGKVAKLRAMHGGKSA